MKYSSVLLLPCFFLSVMDSVMAASTSFQNPSTASWGNWDRGDAGTIYVHWEEINGLPVQASNGQTVFIPYDDSPDVGNIGTAAVSATQPGAELIVNNPGAFITGGGFGGNIYSFSDTPDFTINVRAASLLNEPVRVAMQLSHLGEDLDVSSLLLNGSIAPDSVELLFTQPATGNPTDPDSGDVFERLFIWNLSAGLASYTFDFNAQGSSLSLDAVSIDIGPSTVASTQVPIPFYALTLLGFVLAFTGQRK